LFFATPPNVNSLCESWMKKMGISDYLIHSSNGQTTLYIKYAGSLDELEKSVDAAKVISKNENARELRVELE
jgi:hypothetical protein